jgi:hypothetical protein
MFICCSAGRDGMDKNRGQTGLSLITIAVWRIRVSPVCPHFPSTIGSTGGWVDGGHVNPNSYISVTNSQTLDDPTDGTDYAVNSDEEVFCSGVGGLVYLQDPGPTVLRIATTYFGPPVVQTDDKCYWGSLACSPGTHPTCQVGSGYTFAPTCPQYVKTDYLVVNTGVTAPVCIGIGLIFAASGPGPCN